jgi:hypothetical protein
MGGFCLVVALMVIAGVIILAMVGWQGLVGVIVAGIIVLILWLRSKEGKKYFEKAESEKRALEESQQIWQQASQSNKMVKCKACGNEIAELSAVCPKCGVTLPGLRIKCPKCSSSNITVAKKGFNVGQAAAGGIAVGTVGLAAGMIGSGDLQFVCLACNHRWKVSASQKARTVSTSTQARPIKTIDQTHVNPKAPYMWLGDIQKYRCEYCFWAGKYHYCKTLKGIKKHIMNLHPER